MEAYADNLSLQELIQLLLIDRAEPPVDLLPFRRCCPLVAFRKTSTSKPLPLKPANNLSRTTHAGYFVQSMEEPHR
ncbi:hypothetical protein Pdw03_4437 [Penicillium digitatum]|uniref:Uncharacterized protein n=1 Tax=Penicillium digitatum TaxID=36651 RepID=A0A7T6XI42_PENDI|nr:hypothetical protein Pdw03_4437 [Penicillium digitatum]